MITIFTKTNLRQSIFGLVLLIYALPAHAGEGMWLPLLLQSLNEDEMKSMGMKMDAEDIYSVNHGSLKDAIVHFNGSCTGAVISDQGLLLTNHHCGYNAIQSHSTLDQNYLRDGFWAKSLGEEIPSEGVFARFIVRIDNVTNMALKDVDDDIPLAERQSQIDQNLNQIKASTTLETWQDIIIKPFFEGNQYFLFVTETYNDVRYVGSPPESIGKFGADTDNWVWPRHTGDFSVFRIYAGPDNKPAAYSPENKPLKPKHFLPVSLDGIDEGDFTLVYGFPGSTDQYLPSFALEQMVEIVNPATIAVRDISLKIMEKHMRTGEEIRLAYSPKFNGISNYWKKYKGQVEGIESTGAIEIKRQQEKEFTTLLQKNKKLNNAYGEILPKMDVLYRDLESVAKNRTLLYEAIAGRNIELFKLTSYADRLNQTYLKNGETGYNHLKEITIENLDKYFKDYRVEIDEELFGAVMEFVSNTMDDRYLPDYMAARKKKQDFKQWTQTVFSQTSLTDKDKFIEAINQGGAAFSSLLESDTAYQIYSSLKEIYNDKLSLYNTALYDQINPLQSEYVTALMDVYPKRRFWPDGNSTMRVTYGQVEGFSPKDGITYNTQTYLNGVMEKYVPGDYEFDVPAKLIELYEAKDYGVYGEDGKMPIAFIASNHTTNGNSGSPAIDAFGNLIGLNFDRLWEGTMSDLYYDKSICRNIMVDARYILFIIDKFGDAPNLVNEMKLVHPKS